MPSEFKQERVSFQLQDSTVREQVDLYRHNRWKIMFEKYIQIRVNIPPKHCQ